MGTDEKNSNNGYFAVPDDDLPVVFAQQFTQAGGTLYYCSNEQELASQLSAVMAELGIDTLPCSTENLTAFLSGAVNTTKCGQKHNRPTICAFPCQALLAHNGSTVVTDQQGLENSELPQYTILIAFTSQVTTEWLSAYSMMRGQYGTLPNQIYIFKPSLDMDHKLYMMMIEDQN